MLKIIIWVAVIVVLLIGATQSLRFVGLPNRTTMSMPNTTAGLSLTTDPTSVAAVQQLLTELKKQGTTNAKAAGYANGPLAPAQVIVVGISGWVLRPGARLNAEFEDASKRGLTITDIKDYPPGSLGGELGCGSFPSSAGSVCIWADHGSVGFVIVLAQQPTQAAKLTLLMRADIQHRG